MIISSKCTNSKIGIYLSAYEYDALPENKLEQFEMHLLECDYCMNEIKDFSKFSHLLSKDKQTHQAIRNLIPNITHPEPFFHKIKNHLFPHSPLLLKPAFLIFVILLLILPAYHGLFIQKHHQVLPVKTFTLVPTRANIITKITVDHEQDIVVSFVLRDASEDENYIVKLESEAGTIIWQDNNFSAFDKFGVGSIIFPSELIKNGSYKLSMKTKDASGKEIKQIYFFDINK